ncbi:hypothetical protein ACUY2E_08890 [Corynebacterium confusum]|uniref:hypothetical protein n=1 Tax=uncultured Corynebacterium sp. TaxID=159447 RepID=UPI0025FBEC15|nr:hypothetical protein [uncultured Corynebacterium sp.]
MHIRNDPPAAALYNHTLTCTGEDGRFTDQEDRVLTAFSSLAVPTAAVRVIFATLADAGGHRAALT